MYVTLACTGHLIVIHMEVHELRVELEMFLIIQCGFHWQISYNLCLATIARRAAYLLNPQPPSPLPQPNLTKRINILIN